MRLIILLALTIFALDSFAVRPSPAKTTAEIMNDAYDDFSGATHTGAVYVTLTDKNLTIGATPRTLTEGVHTDFTVTNIPAGSCTTIYTLTGSTTFMSITHNGGGKFLLCVDGTTVGVLAPGEVQYVNFDQSASSTIGLQSESGTISTGDLYLNFFN